MAWGNVVAPCRRMVTPRSKSAATSSGSLESLCKRLSSFVRLIPVQKWRLKAHRHGERPDVIFLHLVAKLEVLGAVHVEKFRPHPDHEKLPDLFFERQLAQGLLRPFFTSMIEVDGAGTLEFFLAEGGGRYYS